MTTWTEPELVAYLLGRLPPEQQVALEERYFADDALHEDVQATADDLMHAYLAGGLSPDDRERFESYFLASPAQRERLEFVRALVARIERLPPVKRPAAAPRPAMAAHVWKLAASVVLVLGAAWLLRAPAPPVVIDEPAVLPAPSASPGHVAARPAPNAVVQVAAAAANVDVLVTDAAGSVRFEMAVSGEHPSYDVTIEDSGGREVWRAEELVPERADAPLTFAVPASVLARDDYRLVLRGETLRSDAPSGPTIVTLRIRRAER